MPSPLVPPPLNDPGALTWPRMLQRWLDDNPVTRLTRTSTYIQLPIFNQGVYTWNGYSDIVAAFNFEGPNGFSLQNIVPPTNPNYACCIAYVVNSTVVTRYLLWDATGSVLPGSITPYVNQPIKKNFRLEVWNTSQGIASETAGVTIYTSKLGNFDYRYASDGNLITPDAISTNFQDAITANVQTAIVVSGAGTIQVNGTYYVQNNYNGNPLYLLIGQSLPPVTTYNTREYNFPLNTVIYYLDIEEVTWAIQTWIAGSVYNYISRQNCATPDLATDWIAYSNTANPAPTLTSTVASAWTIPFTFPTGSNSTTN